MTSKLYIEAEEIMESRIITLPLKQGTVVTFLTYNSVDFADQFARISEYAEHPEFKGQVFSHADLHESWLHENKIAYHHSVVGINLPDKKVCEFFKTYAAAGELTEREQALHAKLVEQGLMNNEYEITHPFFVIAVNDALHGVKMRRHIIMHELSHAFYYLVPEYKKMAHEVYAEIHPEDREAYDDYLRRIYTEDRIVDETIAHTMAGDGYESPVDVEGAIKIMDATLEIIMLPEAIQYYQEIDNAPEKVENL